MAREKNKVEDSSSEKPEVEKKKLHTKVFPFVAGETKNCHEKILQKLNKRGAKTVTDITNSKVVLVFCPIVSRLEIDINSALSELKELHWSKLEGSKKIPKVILVVMHHTFEKNYTVPPKQQHSNNDELIPVVHCLFQEKEGLLKCAQNKTAIKKITKEMMLRKRKSCTVM